MNRFSTLDTLPQFIVRTSIRSWRQAAGLTAGGVGKSGLFVHSSRPVSIGALMVVELHLPDATVLRLQGHVVPSWSVEQAPELLEIEGFGIQFDPKHAGDLMLLEALAESNAERGGSSEGFITLPVLLISTGDGSQQMTSAHRTALRGQERPATSMGQTRGAVELFTPDAVDIDVNDLDPPDLVDGPAALDNRTPTSELPVISVGEQLGERSASTLAVNSIFGIDFGTSYSRIAIHREGQVVVLTDEDGQTIVPSVVHYPRAETPVVGWPARFKLATEPASTVVAPKRMLGIRPDDERVRSLLSQMRVATTVGPTGAIVAMIRGENITIIQVVADILRHLRQMGQRATGIEVRRVVIGAPVSFGPDQRTALRRAAELAGLEVVALIHEPFAAALAYNIDSNREGTMAVYDFGGGTFDFTLARVVGGQFEVISQAGDAWLGGQDFDLALAEHAANVFEHKHHVDLRRRQVEWQQLLLLCEGVKHRLSTLEQTDLLARGMLRSVRGPVDLRLSFDRELLAELCFSLVQRSVEVASDCMREAHVTPEGVDQVVVTGGISRIPLVRAQVQKFFHRPLEMMVSPEQAIVVGNTLYGATLTD